MEKEYKRYEMYLYVVGNIESRDPGGIPDEHLYFFDVGTIKKLSDKVAKLYETLPFAPDGVARFINREKLDGKGVIDSWFLRNKIVELDV